MTIENNPVGDGGQASEPQPFSLNDDGTVNIPDGDSMTSVSVEELGKGFMRQSDYTRKTQDLALQRKDLASAQQLYDQLQANPHGMVTALADQLGVQLPQAPAPQTQNNRHDDDWDSGGWDEGTQPAPQQEDPRVTQMMDMFTQLQSQLNQVATNQARTSVETELDGVVAGLAEIGVQVEDSAAIVRFAKDRNMGNLADAANLMYQDDIVEARVAAATQEQQIVEQKREASQVVTPGVGVAGETPAPSGEDGTGLDLRAALDAALSEHGVSDIRQVSFDAPVRDSY